MKIVLATPGSYIGGFTTFLLNFGRQARQRGIRCSGLLLDALPRRNRELDEALANTIYLKRGLRSRRSYLQHVLDRIEELAPDALILNNVPCVQLLLQKLPPRICRISVVHSLAPEQIRTATSHSQFLDAIVAVSPSIKTATPAQAIPVVCVPVGVEIPEVAKAGDKRGRLRIVSAGRVAQRHKNLRLLVPIVRDLTRADIAFSLTVVGDGPLLNELRRHLPIAMRPEHLLFTGAVSHSEAQRLLALSDVFLLPSTSEGTPHALLEAMAAGAVPICSNLPGSTSEIVQHWETGVLCPVHDVSAFVSAIARLSENRALLSTMQSQTQEAVRRQFSASRMFDAYLELINSRRLPLKTIPGPSTRLDDAFLKSQCLDFGRNLRRHAARQLRQLGVLPPPPDVD